MKAKYTKESNLSAPQYITHGSLCTVPSAQNAKSPKFTWQSHVYHSRHSLLVSLKPQLPEVDLFAFFNAFIWACTQRHNANYYIASFICLHICFPHWTVKSLKPKTLLFNLHILVQCVTQSRCLRNIF